MFKTKRPSRRKTRRLGEFAQLAKAPCFPTRRREVIFFKRRECEKTVFRPSNAKFSLPWDGEYSPARSLRSLAILVGGTLIWIFDPPPPPPPHRKTRGLGEFIIHNSPRHLDLNNVPWRVLTTSLLAFWSKTWRVGEF